jgi:hypothetical protein
VSWIPLLARGCRGRATAPARFGTGAGVGGSTARLTRHGSAATRAGTNTPSRVHRRARTAPSLIASRVTGIRAGGESEGRPRRPLARCAGPQPPQVLAWSSSARPGRHACWSGKKMGPAARWSERPRALLDERDLAGEIETHQRANLALDLEIARHLLAW